MKQSVVAVCSGGMDSVTMLKELLDEGYDVKVLNFSYGSKHNERERSCLMDVCDLLGVRAYFYDLPVTAEEYIPNIGLDDPVPILRSDLLKTGGEIPEGHYEEPNMKKTVVPFRNGIMLSLAVGFAESHDASAVYLGSHQGDRAVYPDCRKEFTAAFNLAAQLGTYNGVEIVSMFNNITKADIVRIALECDAPLHKTWSCYRGQSRPCLRCGTCYERTEAFLLAGVKDPSLTDEEWEEALRII
jgi:7-cyano-7-deazaguanine synthase